MVHLKDKVVDRKGIIFTVEEIVEKDFGSGVEQYYLLKPYITSDFSDGYTTLVPVSKADQLLKSLIDKKEALDILENFEEIKPLEDVNPREKRNIYLDIIASGNRTEICRVYKSLINLEKFKWKYKKTLSDFDEKLLKIVYKLLINEIALVLDIPTSDVSSVFRKNESLI